MTSKRTDDLNVGGERTQSKDRPSWRCGRRREEAHAHRVKLSDRCHRMDETMVINNLQLELKQQGHFKD
ncbi:hypothetical protein EVAR_76625_1 [Eumeta japonica]|uniref:Uncharacterized protein n=1 Tax=Eumeta variegata TaxID=151549 RepID=A0A4C1T8N3_EUMVA|nr:hypothetical protein EVAR_76625_1 [Eumeta japonica]